MGLYLETGQAMGKVADLQETLDAEIITQPLVFDVPEGKVLVCVVQNPFFEAAGVCPDEREFQAFSEPDGRPRTWLLIDKELVVKHLRDIGINDQKLAYYGLIEKEG